MFGCTVNGEALFTVPPGVVTLTAPVSAVPVMATAVPTGPLIGETSVIDGAGGGGSLVGDGGSAVTANCASEVAVPSGAATAIDPDTAPSGTWSVMFVSSMT